MTNHDDFGLPFKYIAIGAKRYARSGLYRPHIKCSVWDSPARRNGNPQLSNPNSQSQIGMLFLNLKDPITDTNVTLQIPNAIQNVIHGLSSHNLTNVYYCKFGPDMSPLPPRSFSNRQTNGNAMTKAPGSSL